MSESGQEQQQSETKDHEFHSRSKINIDLYEKRVDRILKKYEFCFVITDHQGTIS